MIVPSSWAAAKLALCTQAVPPEARPVTSPRPAARIRSRLQLWQLGLAIALAVHLASAGWHIFHGALNADEGFYAIATRSVAEGELPYRDFGFPQPPLVLYANCLPLQLLGYGLFAQRAVNGAWALLGLGLATIWLARRTHITWALTLALAFSLSAPWMYFIHLGKTYGFTSLLTVLGAWVFLVLRPGPQRQLLLGFLAAFGLATRLPAAPFFAVLWLLALFPGRRPTAREFFGGIGGSALGLAVLVLPFWLAAPDAVRFWVMDLHRASLLGRNWHVTWPEIVTLAPSVWLLAVAALAVVAWRRKFPPEAGVMLASAIALGGNLFPDGAYEEYGVPFLLPLAIAGVAILYDEFKERRAAALILLAAGVTAQFLAAPALYYNALPDRRGTPSSWLPLNAPAYDSALPAELAGAKQIVERVLPPDAPFIGPNLILAAETNHPVPRELRMGAFAFTAEMPADRAARLHLVTPGQLAQWFAQPDVTVLGFFSRTDLNYRWSMPSFGKLPDVSHDKLFEPVLRDYAGAYREGQFMLFVRHSAASKLASP